MSKGFKSLHFWLCPSGLNKPQTGHWKTGVYDSRNALESASALRTLAQYARPILLVSSLKASNLSKPSCIFPVNKEKPNAPPELLPCWRGVVSDNLCLWLSFCSKEQGLYGRCCGHVQLHVVVGKRCSSCRQTPPPLLKQRLFPHVDCWMSHSRSSRFSQTVQLGQWVEITMAQSTGSPRRGCVWKLLKLRNQLICVLFASKPHGSFGITNVFICELTSCNNQVGCNAFSKIRLHWWFHDSQFVVNKIKLLNLSAKFIHISSSSKSAIFEWHGLRFAVSGSTQPLFLLALLE